MIKIGQTDNKGNPKKFVGYMTLGKIERLKERANILKDNGETGPKKAFWSKKKLKT